MHSSCIISYRTLYGCTLHGLHSFTSTNKATPHALHTHIMVKLTPPVSVYSSVSSYLHNLQTTTTLDKWLMVLIKAPGSLSGYSFSLVPRPQTIERPGTHCMCFNAHALLSPKSGESGYLSKLSFVYTA